MTIALVDTTILVDLLRKFPAALAWFHLQPRFDVASISAMELIHGALDKTAQYQSLKLLRRFDLIYPTETDLKWAYQQLILYRLSHGVGIEDCLIASISYRLQVPLYTHNLKHMQPLLGKTLAIRPY